MYASSHSTVVILKFSVLNTTEDTCSSNVYLACLKYTCRIMTIALITGTRPEIIKMFPIMKIFDSRSIDYTYIHTGQHYDNELFTKFIQEFGIRKPDYYISIKEPNPILQVSVILREMGIIINKLKPSLVLIEGDTNSVLASALAALKSTIPIAHVESGLRSNDWRTVEEHNRRMVDHVSDILFSPTEISSENLHNEHVYGEVHTVGNTVMDAINLCLSKENRDDDIIDEEDVLPLMKIDPAIGSDFVLVTMHRAENVDNQGNLKQVLIALSDSNLNYVFPMHPHTRKRIEEFGLTKLVGKNINIINPAGYIEFLRLLKKCKFVITDSGGVQEEITSPYINKRALILRDCTERPESVESGHSILCKIDNTAILDKIKILVTKNANETISYRSPYGNGDSANKITEIIEKKFT
jgi:UDP-N-acetylglucosamine 2-epimerase (non-hydrolysing)